MFPSPFSCEMPSAEPIVNTAELSAMKEPPSTQVVSGLNSPFGLISNFVEALLMLMGENNLSEAL